MQNLLFTNFVSLHKVNLVLDLYFDYQFALVRGLDVYFKVKNTDSEDSYNLFKKATSTNL